MKKKIISMMAESSRADAPLFNVADTDGTGAGRVTCDGGGVHVPITFDGHFRALCPLCAALERAAEMAEDVNKLENAEEAAEEAESRVEELENRELRYNELIETQDAAIKKAAGLLAAALDADEDIEGEKAAREALAVLREAQK